MEATNLGCYKFSWKPISKNIANQRARGRSMQVVRMSWETRDGDHLGKSVDESMIVLRLRIKEMKMLEMKNQEAPSDWMELEKQYYAHNYDEDVCEAMGLLQSYLMSLRPSVALGMLAFVAMSVMISSGVGLFHAMAIAKSLLSCLGLS